ncbi:MAG: NrfD/PsrC family molybdoenzyme membrane anchor subunit [Acidobacteriota bacterium]
MEVLESADIRELKLDAIRREAKEKGIVEAPGIRPVGSPFPIASPQTGYYGHHLLKEPQWTELIPLYFFVGGATGSLGAIGALADLISEEKDVALTARWMALGGAALSGVLLIIDLGRPSRFLNMLRVFKPQSTMSMGSWVLSGFSASAGMASFADLLHQFFGPTVAGQILGALGRAGSALFAMPFHNYTGVLIGATAIPVWNSHVAQLPREFGMSGLQSATSLLELAGYESRTSLNLLGLLSSATETFEFARELAKPNPREEDAPLRKGASGALVTTSAVLSGPLPLGLRIAAMVAPKRHRRKLRIAAAIAGVLGSLCLRYGWVKAGAVSAQDWKLPLRRNG